MTISWLVYCLLISTLASVAAWLGERACRAQGWPLRWAWAGGLVATVALPLWAWLAPAPVAGGPPGPLPGAYVMEALPPLTLSQSEPASLSLEAIALLGWAAASGLLVLWLVLSGLRLTAARRGWREAELHGVPVLVSRRTGPAALGLLRGRVVLPTWALELDERRRRLMVLHEAEHVRAGDPRLAVAGLVLCALMPWNLPVWWQLRRLRLAIEMDCDARVLRRSGDLRGYGSLLLEVGRRQPWLALGLAETSSLLERRIRMITMTTTGRHTVRALGMATVAGLVLAVACETPGPAEVSDPERRTVELEDVVMSVEEEECRPTVYLDGSTVPWGEIESLSRADIETIEVFKGAGAETVTGDSCGAIWISTRAASPEARARSRQVLEDLRARAAGPAQSEEEIAAAPTFTPMTVRPQLRNQTDVMALLESEYPPLLREAGIGGTTNVWFFIDDDGQVAKTQVNEGSGRQALDEAALRVAAAMEFSPALLEGEPVPVWLALDIRFESMTDVAPSRQSEARTPAGTEARERAASVRAADRADRAAGVPGEPTFTPMTERPELRNQEEVRQLLDDYYPPLLRDAGIGGSPNVWLYIDEEGTVRDVRINSASGYEALDQAALYVARRMAFTPAMNRDEAVAVWVALDITFEVQ